MLRPIRQCCRTFPSKDLKKQETTEHGQKFIFGFGNVDDQNTFREEIHLELLENGLRYTYFCGMPDGDFAERSGCFFKQS